jgi:hypothetical protein
MSIFQVQHSSIPCQKYIYSHQFHNRKNNSTTEKNNSTTEKNNSTTEKTSIPVEVKEKIPGVCSVLV